MACATDCHDCGAPDAVLVTEATDPETGTWSGLYLCQACEDVRNGVPQMADACMVGDGEGRR